MLSVIGVRDEKVKVGSSVVDVAADMCVYNGTPNPLLARASRGRDTDVFMPEVISGWMTQWHLYAVRLLTPPAVLGSVPVVGEPDAGPPAEFGQVLA